MTDALSFFSLAFNNRDAWLRQTVAVCAINFKPLLELGITYLMDIKKYAE